MKMSVNPQESMDKFLQRLEKSVMDFLATGNKAKVGVENKLFPFPPIATDSVREDGTRGQNSAYRWTWTVF